MLTIQKNKPTLTESFKQLSLDFHHFLQSHTDVDSSSISQPIATHDALTLQSIPIVRCRRRTLGITVHRGRVEIRAPMRLAKRDINAFVAEKWEWINDKVSEQQIQMEETLRIVNATTLQILDQPLTLKVIFAQEQGETIRRSSVKKIDDALLIKIKAKADKTPPDAAHIEQAATALFFRWIQIQAAQYMTASTDAFAKQLGLSSRLSEVKFRRTKSKWGHCTQDGQIQYNPLIILAPKNVVDYIIAHEVCHLVHANHSKRFWALVDKNYAFREDAEQWLKQSGHRIAIEL